MTFHNFDEVLKDLKECIQNKKGFSFVSLGDAEQIFLAVPELYQTDHIGVYLSISGVKPEDTELKKEIIKLLPENDYIFTHKLDRKDTDPRIGTGGWDWARFFYVYPEIFEFYGINPKITIELEQKYKSIVDGTLFETIKGLKVLWVGHYAPEIERRTKNPDFINHYKKFGLDKITTVGSIGCSPELSVGDEVADMIKQAEKIDFDVAIIGMGIASLYFAPLLKQKGKIVLDVGHALTAFAGEGDPQRMFIKEFDYDRQN